MELNWYAVYTKPRSERSFEKHSKLICETYLPMQQVRRKWSDRWKMQLWPLIPSVLFVRIHEEQRWELYNLPWMRRILSVEGRIKPVPEKDILVVRAVEKSRLPFEFTNERPLLGPGDRVVFNGGALIGQTGYIVSAKNGSKMFVQVPSLNGGFTVDIEHLAPDYSSHSTEEILALSA